MTLLAKIRISPGEFFDHYSILCLKGQEILDDKKRSQACYRLQELERCSEPLMYLYRHDAVIYSLVKALHVANARCWKCHNLLRKHLQSHTLDASFTDAAKELCRESDARYQIKAEIDQRFSQLGEVKDYPEYEGSDDVRRHLDSISQRRPPRCDDFFSGPQP